MRVNQIQTDDSSIGRLPIQWWTDVHFDKTSRAMSKSKIQR